MMSVLDTILSTLNLSKFLVFFMIFLIIISFYLFLTMEYSTSSIEENSSHKKSKKSDSQKNSQKNNPKDKDSHADIQKTQSLKLIKNKYNEQENNYIFSEITNIPNFSNESFNYYKEKKEAATPIINKDKEFSFMLIESLSSLNCSQNDDIEKAIFKEINWNKSDNEGDEENIVSNYLYPNNILITKNKNSHISSSSSSITNLDTDSEENEKEIFLQYKLGIIRTFSQEKENLIKTNIVKETNGIFYKIYSKGDAELIKKICKKDSLPNNYDDIVKEYKNKGFNLIGLSGKILKMNYLQSQKIERNKCENNMNFLGFIAISFNGYKGAYS